MKKATNEEKNDEGKWLKKGVEIFLASEKFVITFRASYNNHGNDPSVTSLILHLVGVKMRKYVREQ
jgi:hypothetical protein